MSEMLVFERYFGPLEVWIEDDASVVFDWHQPTDESRAYPLRIELSADEVEQVLAKRGGTT